MADKLALASVKPIMQIMVDDKTITPEQRDAAQKLASADHSFVGQAAIKMGILTEGTLNVELLKQADLKADAAEKDIKAVASGASFDAPPAYMQNNWGNNGVNKAIANPTVVDGATAAVNIAQNLVVDGRAYFSEFSPEYKKLLADTVDSATHLAQGIAGKEPMTAEQAKNWRDAVKDGVKELSPAIDHKDKKGANVNVDAYLNARLSEIDGGIAQRQKIQEQLKSAGISPSISGATPAAAEDSKAANVNGNSKGSAKSGPAGPQ